jgi:hypothetical protein
MNWAVSYAVNRLFALAVIALVLHNVFRDQCGVGDAYLDQINHWLGFDDLARALERRF